MRPIDAGPNTSNEPAELESAVAHAAATFERIDALVNNAGVFPFGAIEDVSLAEIDHTLAVHLRAAFFASQQWRIVSRVWAWRFAP